jgi:hypothetical protein
VNHVVEALALRGTVAAWGWNDRFFQVKPDNTEECGERVVEWTGLCRPDMLLNATGERRAVGVAKPLRIKAWHVLHKKHLIETAPADEASDDSDGQQSLCWQGVGSRGRLWSKPSPAAIEIEAGYKAETAYNTEARSRLQHDDDLV